MNLPLYSLLIAVLVAAPAPIQCQSSQQHSWTALSVLCIASTTPAIDKSPSSSEIDCVSIASWVMPRGLLIAQINLASKLCSTFSYQSVCSQLVTGVTAQCLTFVRFPIDIRSISSKLSNLWLADDVSRLENLVCQIDKDTNRFYPVNTAWTSDGLNFDGMSSYMILNKTSIGFTGGLTWLLRIKRTPQVQPYFEFNSCSTLGTAVFYSSHMWEYPNPRVGLGRPHRVTGTLIPNFITSPNQLSSSANDWVEIGITMEPASNLTFYYNGSFLPKSTYAIAPGYDDFPPATLCVIFGRRFGNSAMFSGTLGALAFANSSMTEDEIRTFYSTISGRK